jgi:DNA adenine methylase
MNLRPPIKTHGGKWYLRKFVIEHFPKNYQELDYCELCCGGCSVGLNKLPSPCEMINDIDHKVTSIFKALRDEPKEFIERIKRIKYTEPTFTRALRLADSEMEDYIDVAVNEYVLRRMSRGGMKKAFAWSERKRGGKPGDQNAWETMTEQLPLLAERIKSFVIINKKFLEVFKVWDEEKTFIYIDPPYLPATRSVGSTDIYDNEMSTEDHVDMLSAVRNARGKVMISGYPSSLYNKYLKGWKTTKKELVNHSSQQKVKEKRVEQLWMNY